MATLSLQNKVAIVTGSGRGIGRATAEKLHQLGASVTLVSRTRSELDGVAKSLGERCLVFEGDISEESTVQRLFAATLDRLGPVDVLINNAAIFHTADVIDHSVKAWDEVMAVNVRGAFLCSREAFRQMVAHSRAGAIINISSLGGVRGTEKFPGLSSYVASKFALVGLTESLAVEGRKHGIRANCIAPGAVATEMLKKAAPHLRTHTTPEDIAKSVAWLCDNAQSSHVSGALLEIYSNLAN